MAEHNPYKDIFHDTKAEELWLMRQQLESLQSIARSLNDLGASVVLNGVRINNS